MQRYFERNAAIWGANIDVSHKRPWLNTIVSPVEPGPVSSTNSEVSLTSICMPQILALQLGECVSDRVHIVGADLGFGPDRDRPIEDRPHIRFRVERSARHGEPRERLPQRQMLATADRLVGRDRLLLE